MTGLLSLPNEILAHIFDILESERVHAATTIQRVWRGTLMRRRSYGSNIDIITFLRSVRHNEYVFFVWWE